MVVSCNFTQFGLKNLSQNVQKSREFGFRRKENVVDPARGGVCLKDPCIVILWVQKKSKNSIFWRFSRFFIDIDTIAYYTVARDPAHAVIFKLDSGELKSSDGISAEISLATLQD